MLQFAVLGQRRRVFYGWVVVAGGFLNQVLTSGLGFQGFGAFIVPLQREFGWSKAQLSAARAFMQMENGLMGPLEGFLVDRFGPRRIMLVGTLIFGLGLVLFSLVHSLWQYYAAFLVVALGTGLGGFLVMIVAINQWFRRKRTLAMSLSMLGLGFGGITLVPLLVWAVESYGWRTAALGSGVFVWAAGIPAALMLRDAPEKYGTGPDGDPPGRPALQGPDSPAQGQYDFTLLEAVRTRAFWFIGLGHGFSLMAISAASVHQFAHMEEGLGISPQAASGVVVVLSATNMVGRLIGGVLGDRLNKRYLGALGMTGTGGAMLIFALADSYALAMLYGVLYGFFWGFRGPMIDSLRADYFGRAHYGKISGTASLLVTPASVVSPVFAGYMADTYGDYQLGFLIIAGLSCTGALLFLLARRPALPARLQVPAQASRAT